MPKDYKKLSGYLSYDDQRSRASGVSIWQHLGSGLVSRYCLTAIAYHGHPRWHTTLAYDGLDHLVTITEQDGRASGSGLVSRTESIGVRSCFAHRGQVLFRGIGASGSGVRSCFALLPYRHRLPWPSPVAHHTDLRWPRPSGHHHRTGWSRHPDPASAVVW